MTKFCGEKQMEVGHWPVIPIMIESKPDEGIYAFKAKPDVTF
jgi:hypothetical protein